MKKYNNKSVSVRDWTTQKLMNELLQITGYLENAFDRDGCFGIGDIRFKCAIAGELDRRAMLRKVTYSERVNMKRRQIAEVKP